MNQIVNDAVVYTVSRNRQRGVLHSYHRKPSPRDDFKKGGKRDVQGLPRKYQSVVIGGDGESKYMIGFEVEKNSIDRSVLREYALFCGFERDGSCGVEAVTNPLPLLPASHWRTKVFDLMFQASRVIDDVHSPGDGSCGGHITVSVKGFTGDELLVKMRPYAGLLMAMFRHRMKNAYCGYDPTLMGELNSNDRYGYYHQKYRVALPKSVYVGNGEYVHLLEWRLPSRFTDVAQMMARYEFFFEFVDASVNGDGSDKSFKAFLKKVRPIVGRLYGGNKELMDKVYDYAYKFRSFIMDAPKRDDEDMANKHAEVIGFLYRGL